MMMSPSSLPKVDRITDPTKDSSKENPPPLVPHPTIMDEIGKVDPKTMAALGALLGFGGGLGYNTLTGSGSPLGPTVGALSGLVAGYGGKHLYDAINEEDSTKKKEARLTNFLFSLSNL